MSDELKETVKQWLNGAAAKDYKEGILKLDRYDKYLNVDNILKSRYVVLKLFQEIFN